MGLKDELVEIENELAAGGPDEYEHHLRDDAVVIVPGMRLDKAGTVQAMAQSPGWDEFAITDEAVLELGDDAAVLTYTFHGSRGSDESAPDGYADERGRFRFTYAAHMTSAYARTGDGWRLVSHQQTPLD